MDLITPAAFMLAVVVVIAADLMDGGTLRSLVNLPAMLLVLGGTLGASVMSTATADLRLVPTFFSSILRPRSTPVERTIDDIAALAEVARREGFLRLEDELDRDSLAPFLQRGVRLIVDGADEERLRTVLEQELTVYEAREATGVRFFETAGGFAPTLGIIGTVVGLVSVLSNLANVQKLAPSIATAFIATLWGISTANFFWLPLAYKLRNTLAHELQAREMIIEGCIAIAAGQNPRLISEQLAVFVPPRKTVHSQSREDLVQGEGQTAHRLVDR